MKILRLLPVLLLFSTFSCQQEEGQDIKGDYLVIGRFYGECVGDECTRYLKLDNEEVFENEDLYYPQGTARYSKKWKSTTKTSSDRLTTLLRSFPPRMFEETSPVGSPDSHDQGGVYLEVRIGNSYRVWLIDNDDNDMNGATRDYRNKISSILAEHFD